jgi:hypothetical protein
MTTAIGIQIAGQGAASGRNSTPAPAHPKIANGFPLSNVFPAVQSPEGSDSSLRQAFVDALKMLGGNQNPPDTSSTPPPAVTEPSSQQDDSHAQVPAPSIGLAWEQSSFPSSEIGNSEVRSGSRHRYPSIQNAQPRPVAPAQQTPQKTDGKIARPQAKEYGDHAKADAAGVAARELPLSSSSFGAVPAGFSAPIPEPARSGAREPSALSTTHGKQPDLPAGTGAASGSAGPVSDLGVGRPHHAQEAGGVEEGRSNQNGSLHLPQPNGSSTNADQPGSDVSDKWAETLTSTAPLRAHESNQRIADGAKSSPPESPTTNLSPSEYQKSPHPLTPSVQAGQAEYAGVAQAADDKSRMARVQSASLEGQPKPSGPDQDGKNPVSALGPTAAMPEIVRVAAPVSNSAAGANEVSAVRQAFDALDAGDASAVPVWTHAGANRAEAGYQDQQYGWIAVRAQMGTDGIHATLVPDSAGAAQTLGSHLAGLSTYLIENHLPVESLTIATAASHENGPGMGQGNGQSSGGETNQERHSGGQTDSIRSNATFSKNGGITSAAPGASAAPTGAPWNGGVYVSVIA